MKRTAMQHTKLKRLVRVLQVPQYAAVGILESLWHLTAREAPMGNIGKLSNEDIAAWIDWTGDADSLMGALVSSGWVDSSETDRLVIHDWLEHADDATKLAIKRKTTTVSGSVGQTPTTWDKTPLPEPLPVPVPVPKDKQKISRAKKLREARNKPPCKTDLAKVRHKEFKAAIGLYWKSKNPGVEMPWGAPEGQALEIWLRESPNTSIDQFTGFLRHRFKSEANHTERPSAWIRNVTSYAVEPLDKYGKPQSIGGTHAKSTANSRFDRSQASTARVLSDLLGPDLDLSADSGGRTLEAGS